VRGKRKGASPFSSGGATELEGLPKGLVEASASSGGGGGG